MRGTWTGNSFHIWYYTCFNAILPNQPTLSLSHRVQKTVLYISVSFAVSLQGYRYHLSKFHICIKFYICVSILYSCCSFWLTSLCIIGSSFIHLIRTDSNVFFLMAEQYSIVYMYHGFHIHSSADGHLGCFHVLAIINSAANMEFLKGRLIRMPHILSLNTKSPDVPNVRLKDCCLHSDLPVAL